MKISKSAIIKAGAAIIILGGGIGAMVLLSSSKAEANKREVEPPVRKVEIIIPEFKDIPFLVDGNGMVESARSLSVHSTTSGKVVYSYNNLNSGTSVHKDDVLLKIDSRQAENSLNLARAELIKAVASIVPQFKTSNGQLYSKWNNYLNSLNFQEAETPDIPVVSNPREKLLISTYGIYSTYFNVKNAEIMLEQHTILSPFDGFISGQSILEDSYVNAGQGLFTLIDTEKMKLSVPLTVDELNRIDSGNSPYVEIHPSMGNGTVLSGKLVSRDVQMDRSSQMVNVFIEFTNPGPDPRFAPGNYVDIVIEGRTLENTAAIPRHAVIDNRFVYTFKDGLLSREDITIKAISGDTVFIENTLPQHTKVITTILQKPLLGMKLSALGENNEKDS